MKNKKFWIIVLVSKLIIKTLALIVILLVQQNTIFGSDNAGMFLETGTGARTVALGNSFVALADDANAIYWNPAGLSQIQSQEIQIMAHTMMETDFRSIQYATHYNQWSVGFGYIGSGTPDIQRVSEKLPNIDRYISSGDYFGYYTHGLFLSAAHPLSPHIFMGATLKSIYETLDQYSAVALGADLGLLWQPCTTIKIGVNLQNIIKPTLTWNTPSKNMDSIPDNLKLGFAYSVIPDQLTLLSDLNIRQNRPVQGSLGIEYWFNPYIPFRIGFQTQPQSDLALTDQISRYGSLSIGTGLRLNPWLIDFSWTQKDQIFLNDQYRIAFGVKL